MFLHDIKGRKGGISRHEPRRGKRQFLFDFGLGGKQGGGMVVVVVAEVLVLLLLLVVL